MPCSDHDSLAKSFNQIISILIVCRQLRTFKDEGDHVGLNIILRRSLPPVQEAELHNSTYIIYCTCLQAHHHSYSFSTEDFPSIIPSYMHRKDLLFLNLPLHLLKLSHLQVNIHMTGYAPLRLIVVITDTGAIDIYKP